MDKIFIEEYKNHDYSLLKSYDFPHSIDMTREICEEIINKLLNFIDNKIIENPHGSLQIIIRKIEKYSLPDDIHILNYLRIELLKEIKIHDNDNKKFLYTTMSNIILEKIIDICSNEIKKFEAKEYRKFIESVEAKKPSVS